MERFRLAFVDGFAGAGRYVCGSPGSPVLVLETLKRTCAAINAARAVQGLKAVHIDVLLIVNDATSGVIGLCEENLVPVLGAIRDEEPYLSITLKSFECEFEEVYPQIKETVDRLGFKSSVLFNLDQCGHSQVQLETITDILRSYPAAEVFLTFAIDALISFLPKQDKEELSRRLSLFGVKFNSLYDMEDCMNNQAWLGAAERTVFDTFRGFGGVYKPILYKQSDGLEVLADSLCE